MKKLNVLRLIASSFLLLGSILNLLNTCIDIPYALHISRGPILLVSVILYVMVLAQTIKLKRNKKNNEDDYV